MPTTPRTMNDVRIESEYRIFTNCGPLREPATEYIVELITPDLQWVAYLPAMAELEDGEANVVPHCRVELLGRLAVVARRCGKNDLSLVHQFCELSRSLAVFLADSRLVVPGLRDGAPLVLIEVYDKAASELFGTARFRQFEDDVVIFLGDGDEPV